MSKVFPKLAKSITLAAKNGGPDPETNAPLRIAIANAKAKNMSRDNIDAAIKRAEGKDASEITEIAYEGKGPHGSQFIVECATDNTNRSVTNIKTIFSKNDAQILNTGSLDFMFSRKAVIEFALPKGKDMEEVEFMLIDHGLEELSVDDDFVTCIGDYTAFAQLSQAVVDLGIHSAKSTLQRVPNQPVELSDEQIEAVEVIVDKLEDDDDVQAVYTNLA